MSTVDKQMLRELAEKATPGPWGKDGAYVCPKRAEGEAVHIDSWNSIAESSQPENSRYIAAANPATILALLDEIEALRSQVEQRWISVDERMPEIDQGIIVAASTNFFSGRYCNRPGFSRCIDDRGRWFRGFTHWMPLPDPPQA